MLLTNVTSFHNIIVRTSYIFQARDRKTDAELLETLPAKLEMLFRNFPLQISDFPQYNELKNFVLRTAAKLLFTSRVFKYFTLLKILII